MIIFHLAECKRIHSLHLVLFQCLYRCAIRSVLFSNHILFSDRLHLFVEEPVTATQKPYFPFISHLRLAPVPCRSFDLISCGLTSYPDPVPPLHIHYIMLPHVACLPWVVPHKCVCVCMCVCVCVCVCVYWTYRVNLESPAEA